MNLLESIRNAGIASLKKACRSRRWCTASMVPHDVVMPAVACSLLQKKNRKVRSKKELPKRPLVRVPRCAVLRPAMRLTLSSSSWVGVAQTMNEELKARLARKRVALGGRPATNKAPPKRKNTIAKPVMVVSAATKFKAVRTSCLLVLSTAHSPTGACMGHRMLPRPSLLHLHRRQWSKIFQRLTWMTTTPCRRCPLVVRTLCLTRMQPHR